METPRDVKEYYQRITELNIGEIARELLADRITQETPQRLMCNCPNHQSQSQRSLHIMPDKQGWYCFGCGKGGDVLQLVEFIQSGQITAGKNGTMPESHRQARNFLADKAGVPQLSSFGLSKDELARTEAGRFFEVRVKEALTSLAKLYHARLREHPEVVEWLKSKYAIDDDTIDNLLIGYADNEPDTIQALTTDADGFSLRELGASGAFRATHQDSLLPFFERRLVFPYWSRGQVVFMIGRKTPWTPDDSWEKAKYRKLMVHNKHGYNHIASFINNSVLYNEDLLLTKPDQVIITEGVTDCIALMQQGLPVISPVTVRIRENDWRRLLSKLDKVETVYICQDNEVSQAGLKGAMESARILTQHGIETRLVTLPLGESQLAARQRLQEEFGLPAAVEPNELPKLLQDRSPEDVQEARDLLAEAKIDVNDYFAAGHKRDDFEELMDNARLPVEFTIDKLKVSGTKSKIARAIKPVLLEIHQYSSLEHGDLLKALRKRIGEDTVGMTGLRELFAKVKKELKEDNKQDDREKQLRAKLETGVSAGSCRARMNEVLVETELAGAPVDYTRLAAAAYDWFVAKGGMFFRNFQGEPIMCFSNFIYWMDSGERVRKRLFQAMIFKHTNMLATNSDGRQFIDAMINLAVDRGIERDHFSWLHSAISNHTVWFHLNNERHEIAKITPDCVEIMHNGNNMDGVILTDSRKIKPIRYLPDADPVEADRLLSELLINNLTCTPGDRLLILAWLSCFLLIDFSSTKPMTRFEGSAGCGKTTAAKLISTLLYGEPQHKKSTDAANYTDGSQNPLIALDNIEVKQMTDELTAFMLTSITGVAREKRRGGTDTETIVEKTKCLINTTGIEPLCGDLSEVLSRTFAINFDISYQTCDCFIETKVIADLQKHRDLILSVLMNRTAQVLALIRDGAMEKVMSLIKQTVGSHDKRRCNDYLSMMYLMLMAGGSQKDHEAALKELKPQFIKWIKTLNKTSKETARESNPIAATLHALFNAHRNASVLDEEARYSTTDQGNHISSFIEKYQVRFEDRNTMEPLFAGQLLAAMKRVAREFGLNFAFKDAGQLAKRLLNDKKLLKEAGFSITHEYHSKQKTNVYLVKRWSE